MRDIRARKFLPVYILMGEESYFIDQICNALETTVLPEEERDFNQFVVFGSDTTAGKIADTAREFPMMSEYKVVIVKEAQGLRNTDALEKYLEKPSPQTVLVYCHKNGNIDRRKKLIAKAEAVGIVFESTKVRDRDLPTFVEGFLRQRGVSVDQRTATIIAESIGSDLCRLASELDKLCLALPENQRRATPEMVERTIGVSREYNPYEFRNAVAGKDVAKANRILNYFDKNPKSGGAFVLLPTIFSFFQNLMVAWYAPDKNNGSALAQHLELRSEWQVREYQSGMRNFSAMKTMQILAKIRETDEKTKGLNSGNTSVGDLMKELLFFILH